MLTFGSKATFSFFVDDDKLASSSVSRYELSRFIAKVGRLGVGGGGIAPTGETRETIASAFLLHGCDRDSVIEMSVRPAVK